MKRGRKATPSVLKVLAGNPGKRPIPPNPPYPVGWPEMPSWLDAGGREVWKYVMGQLEHAGVVRLIDRDLLGAYCDFVSAGIKLSKQSRTDVSLREKANKTWTHARLFGALFGIGPAEAGRVTSDVPKDDKEQFFESA